MKIFFHVMDLVGPQNACIGLGQCLQSRGHQVYFAVNEQFANRFTKYGFTELLLKEDKERKEKHPSAGKDPIAEVCKSLEENQLFSHMSSLEKLKRLVKINFFDELYWKARDFEPQLKTLLEKETPDLLIVDCDIVSPCLISGSVPWVYLWCSNPLGFFDDDNLPPFTSGYPIDSDQKQWAEFRRVQYEVHISKVLKYQHQLSNEFGYPILEKQKFIPNSPYLNIYQFPEELDYHDVVQLPAKFQRVDTFIREETDPFELPAEFTAKMKLGKSKLIFLSMGSMGSADVNLMKRLVSLLSKTPHFYIVAKGVLHEQYELAENMWGQFNLPQTKILPLCDAAITHGGNNSLLECIVNAVPVIVMPLFYDQFDNAQRVLEKGYGYRIEPYNFEDDQLLETLERLLNDQQLKEKYVKMAQRIKQSNSKLSACIQMEQLVERCRQK